ncbi:hypothetical protein HMPREF0864_04733 [Enterobacteriaceae bacterium 9_2_54FAA]|nr:hypothetical protein HMPREF0864_04733 [Enterobacteriaceae bacterium 9_2_54FAA]
MTKKVFYLRTEQIRSHAIEQIRNLSLDQSKPYEIELSPPKRTLSQNRKMWPLLHDLAQQVVWYGQKYDEDDWKDLITALVAKTKRRAANRTGYRRRRCHVWSAHKQDESK